MKLSEDLKWREIVDNVTDEELWEKLDNESLTFYVGVDPSADSMHIGHYSTVITLAKRLAMYGHKPIILCGGFTGMIGDPRPTTERAMLAKEDVDKNVVKIKKQVESLLECETVNNDDWLGNLNLLSFLRDYGKLFNINYMLSKDTVKRRLETGITYTEFSYQILQAVDFLKLYENNGVTLQVGGQDQWGNLTAGTELIRKLHPEAKVYGLTSSLITKADGTKMGKSEGGALWIDKEKTSSYTLYQYFINTEDSKVIEYLKKLTFLSREEIEAIEKEFMEAPHLRIAQKRLASEVVREIHGEESLEEAIKITEALFSGDFKSLSEKELEDAIGGFKKTKIGDTNIVDLLVECGASSSKREAREFLNNNAISLNGEKISDTELVVSKESALFNKYVIIRRGKKQYYVCEF